ncbi:hypothetical protein CVT25_005067 [Psilocybe cyanescens]|uniref:Protein kinase domain-containing protein n=1 Tax=Psilocybe cyanescens TaxID=93625 RepID=A0A409XDU6_PSICY|nr:hypothetical protein CVT25_005067 [Psilocybe cyanescens]
MADRKDPPSGSILLPIQSATPRIQRTNADSSTVPAVRPQIAHEMEREFVVCELDIFMKEYLPFVPDDACIRECVSGKLRSRKLVSGTFASTLRFTKYESPPTTACSEMATYADLKKISDAIGDYDYPKRTRNEFHYQNTPHSVIDSDILGSTHKVDACFTSDPAPPARSNTKFRLNTTAMAVPMEHKLTVQQEYENNRQIVSANVQIMNDDVRRMFTFGITIECDQVTLWYHSRSHSAVSRSFSFVQEPKLLIKVFMSILFAKDVELGYDPMVKRGEDSQYTFEIPQKGAASRFFRTIKPIAEYRSNNITGRMTRIFKVIETNTDDPKKYVLKDVWIEDDAQTEGEIQKALFKDITAFWENPTPDDMKDLAPLQAKLAKFVEKEKYKDFFLTIETDCVGEVSKKVPPGAVPQRNLFYPPTITSDFRKTSSLATRKSVGTPRPISNAQQPPPPRGYAKKKQYRVVFKEVCKSVGELNTLGKVTDILHQVLIPLQLMFCAGWVHRDISSGNILAHRHNQMWQVKLSDLEYARKFPPPPGYVPATDPKTGTPYFMPHEILDRTYIYNDELWSKVIPPDQQSDQESDDDDEADSGSEEGLAGVVDSDDIDSDEAEDAVPPTKSVDAAYEEDSSDDDEAEEDPFLDDRLQIVIHNFQHDLESVWWIMLWSLTARIQHKLSNNWAKTIFQNTLQLSTPRKRCFTKSIWSKLNSILAAPAKKLSKNMDTMRRNLHVAYNNREKEDKLRDFGTYVDIYAEFDQFFADIQKHKSWRKAQGTKLLVDSPYHQKAGTQAEPVPEGAPLVPALSPAVGDVSLPAPDIQPQTPAFRVVRPARVKRELSDDERGPPRRPGPSKRSKR